MLYQVVPRDAELPQDNGILEVMLLATIALLSRGRFSLFSSIILSDNFSIDYKLELRYRMPLN